MKTNSISEFIILSSNKYNLAEKEEKELEKLIIEGKQAISEKSFENLKRKMNYQEK